jgi:hypothetical protein
LFECLNLECKRRFTPDDLSREAAETTESEALHNEQTQQALEKPELLGASSSETSYKARQELPSLFGKGKETFPVFGYFLLLILVGGLVFGGFQGYNWIKDKYFSYWVRPNGEREHEYVEQGGARLVGADGNYIELFNNPEAHDPTWWELEEFLRQGTTDQHLYNLTSFVCADFAEMLHNNAEKAGIRAAYVCIDLLSYSEGHTLNAFHTTDQGLIYIDDTGTETGGINADKTVILVKGSEYVPVSIFQNLGYEPQWDSLGIVTDIWVQW